MKKWILCSILFLSFNLSCFSQIEQSDNIDKETLIFIDDCMPIFRGGEAELIKYIKNNLNYPEEAVNKHIEETVVVSFTVSKQGTIKYAKAVKKVDPLLDEEAVRVIYAMPDWIPCPDEKHRTDVTLTLPISFKFEKEENNRLN